MFICFIRLTYLFIYLFIYWLLPMRVFHQYTVLHCTIHIYVSNLIQQSGHYVYHLI
jgi:hypothetical protein